MITILCSDERYIYNIYHITKAFFPDEPVTQKIENHPTNVVSIYLPDNQIISVTKMELAEICDFRQCKYYVDKKIYTEYGKYTGNSLAWGLLTGVRPTKIAMKKLAEGMGKEEFARWFQEDSFVSEAKARLAYEIAERERKLLKELDCQEGFSLYVAIPFCPSVCSYCSFSSGAIAQWKNYVDAYLDTLCREITYIGEKSTDKKLNTIYIGGGTPTTLTASQLEKLLTHIDRLFSRKDLLEYTIEAGRPDSITEEKLKVIKDHKATRISINPQTMSQDTLDRIGRNHTVDEVIRAYIQARELGFDNINMDLIAGLPKETREDMAGTLKEIRKLAPDSLTVHSLAVKRAAKLGQEKSAKGFVADLCGDQNVMAEELSAMIAMAADTAEEMGLRPYYLYRQKNIAGNFENVGYAKVDKAGIYNILIMEEMQSIIAVGAGASTKIVLKHPVIVPGSKNDRRTTLMRIENVKDIREYISRIDEMIERKGEWLWR